MEVKNALGETVQIKMRRFNALDGWELQHQFVEFALSKDNEFRRKYTLEVLSYATVIYKGEEIPLLTDALIDNHLGTWKNVQEVFNAILRDNGVEPETHAKNPSLWVEVGEQMAMSFLASIERLAAPTFDALTNKEA